MHVPALSTGTEMKHTLLKHRVRFFEMWPRVSSSSSRDETLGGAGAVTCGTRCDHHGVCTPRGAASPAAREYRHRFADRLMCLVFRQKSANNRAGTKHKWFLLQGGNTLLDPVIHFSQAHLYPKRTPGAMSKTDAWMWKWATTEWHFLYTATY